jgi:hypothetical protein
LAAADSSNAGWQRDLSVSWEKLGDVRRAQGDRAGAAQAYGDALNVTQRLAAADPSNVQWRRGLSIISRKLASVTKTNR